MACDMCKAVGTDLVSLQPYYQTDTVKQICQKCEKIVNAHLWALRGVTHRWIERRMKKFVGGTVTPPQPDRSALRRFFDRVMAPDSLPGAIIRLPH